MKYIVVLCDGMADVPIDELGGRTPMEAAQKPNMDYLAQNGEVGMIKTVTDGFAPGSDVANLSVMGYEPAKYYSGRSSLEAVSMGIDLKPDDVTFRCNLVNLSGEESYADKTMVDYSSDEIPTEESRELIKFIDGKLGGNGISFYGGFSYRHCMVYGGTHDKYLLTPPHDISGRKIGAYLPKGEGAQRLTELMQESYPLLSAHPINKDREKRGLRPANSLWFWGLGKKPVLDSFEQMTGKKGSVISAVDLIKGIGICAGMKVVEVEGATGNVKTNFDGKAQAAISELRNGADYVYIHIEAPDEAGHRHEIENKVKSIELIDSKIIAPVLKAFDGEDISVAVLPDHPTPLTVCTHTSDPVPYLIYRSFHKTGSGVARFTEKEAEKTGVYLSSGDMLIKKFII